MTQHLVVFSTSGNLPDAQQRWLAPLLASWPGVEAPVMRTVTSDDLALMLGAGGAPTARDTPHAVLIALSPGESPRNIDRLVESLLARNVPALVLMENPASWRAFQRHGVMFERWDAAPQMLAAMLFTLCERQSAVDILAREVMLSQRCQGGIRLEMERLHEELHLAAAVQREFTSAPLPRIPGLDFGVLFRPVNFVSGDIYNVQDLGDGKAAFFIADAVGHGVPAALLTMVLTSSLSTRDRARQGVANILEPAEVLRRLNTRLCESCLGSGRFATALYGVVDANTRSVTVAGAGHPMPVILEASGATEVETDGPLLGVFPDAEFTQATFRLANDQTLILYTDGLEASFPRMVDGLPKRTGAHLAPLTRLGTGAPPAGAIADQLALLLDEQYGSLHQLDDVTALAIAPQRQALSRSKAA